MIMLPCEANFNFSRCFATTVGSQFPCASVGDINVQNNWGVGLTEYRLAALHLLRLCYRRERKYKGGTLHLFPIKVYLESICVTFKGDEEHFVF